MRKATILDLHAIATHLGQYITTDDLLMNVRNLMYSPRFFFYIDEGMVIVFEVLEGREDTVLLHPYIDKGYRGKMFIRALETLESILTGVYDTVVFQPPQDAKHIRRLLGIYPGVVKVNENLYTYKLGGHNGC